MPPKVLSFIWRAVSFCLPTKIQLMSKHVQIDASCPVCHEAPETIYHALVTCRVAAKCWQYFSHSSSTLDFLDFPAWLNNKISGQSRENKAKALTLCWSIWRARNDLVWNNKRLKELKIVAKAWEYLS